MSQKRGASAGFNNPTTIDHSDDMIFQYQTNTAGADDECFAPNSQGPNSAAAPPTISAGNITVMNRAGALSTFFIKGNTNAATVTESWAVMKNGVDTSLVATCVVGSPNARDTLHNVTVVPGDEISIHHHLTGSANFSQTSGSLYFTPA